MVSVDVKQHWIETAVNNVKQILKECIWFSCLLTRCLVTFDNTEMFYRRYRCKLSLFFFYNRLSCCDYCLLHSVCEACHIRLSWPAVQKTRISLLLLRCRYDEWHDSWGVKTFPQSEIEPPLPLYENVYLLLLLILLLLLLLVLILLLLIIIMESAKVLWIRDKTTMNREAPTTLQRTSFSRHANVNMRNLPCKLIISYWSRPE